MSPLALYKEEAVSSTVLSNLFIDEYMKDANDAQLKVYLYLLRMMNARQATSVSDIADKFNHTEKDIIRALKYWEKKNLLTLEFDETKTIVTGIYVNDLDNPSHSKSLRNAGRPSVFVPLPAGSDSLRTEVSTTESAVLPQITPSDSPTAFSNPDAEILPSFEKPVYSADQLREFKNRQDTAQLLFIAQSYIGKPLTPSEMKSILFFTDVLHFSDDLIDYLLQYCVDKGKKDFKYIEKVAINWAEEGITTPKQAQKISSRYDKNVYAIMKQLGRNTSPSNIELEYINRWMKEYGFSMDIIFEACQRTVLATEGGHRFEYAERILNSWKNQNVHHKSDIHKIDDLYQQRKKTSAAAAAKTSAGHFNQFTQNHYDFSTLEQEILSN